MVANALKTWVKQSSPWEERWFVKCNEKLCKLLRRFLQLNNNIKPSLFESLGVSEVRNLYGKYFVFHMNWAIQEASTIFAQSIISNRGNSCEIKLRKAIWFLSCVNEKICIRFRKFSKGTNVLWILFFFNFASQCKLFKLLSYGAYNHRFISVICFLKTTHLSVHRFNSLIFFSHVE